VDSEKHIQLVYDRECPVCEYYCQRIDIHSAAGDLVRVDARENSEVLDEVTALGLDIDAGMVLKVEDEIHYGSAAIHELAQLSSKRGFINRVAHYVFRVRWLANLLYPLLAACRNLLLKILGRSRINNLQLDDNERF
jgi:predicted DCC family thiol-disulfide oxidoreductase YuxK